MLDDPRLLTLGGSVAAVALGVVVAIARWREARRAHWERRLRDGEEDAGTLTDVLAAEAQPKGWAERMDGSFDRLVQRTMLDVNTEQALGYMCLAGVVAGGALFLWRGELWMLTLGLIGGSGLILGIYLFLQGRYRRRIQEQLPDMFYLMARSLRAGLNLAQAIELIGKEGPAPVAEEFRRASAQIELGLSVPAALRNMGRRIRLLDCEAFVSTITLHYQHGGNLAQMLDRLAAGARDRNQFRQFFLSATALGRITAVFLAASGPGLILMYLFFQPEHLQILFQSREGWLTVLGALAVQAIGVLWIYRLFKIEY